MHKHGTLSYSETAGAWVHIDTYLHIHTCVRSNVAICHSSSHVCMYVRMYVSYSKKVCLFCSLKKAYACILVHIDTCTR